VQSEGESSSRSSWRPLLWVIPIALLLLGIAAAVGFFVGQSERDQAEVEQVTSIVQEQFALGLIDLDEERFDVARQRFEYIIQLDPSFPEAPERLADALLGLSEPLAAPTSPPVTPTPNLSPVQDIFDQAQAAFEEGDWDLTIAHLLALRAKDSEFRAVEADGLMYAALRNRGIRRISADKLLEEGIYDLSLAESFALLDEDANNWRSWAQLYLTANSFYGLNWEQAAFYFEVVYSVAPGIRNDVAWKYAQAKFMYGMLLADGGDPCAAEEELDISLEVILNEDLAPTATAVRDACRTATALPPAPSPTATLDGSALPPPTATLDGSALPPPTETPTPDGE
jgi:tetratricopeptide (TPR) repeat protein